MTELEVTGVSRSGRVRKKSSKLTDFESLDEIDIRSNSRVKKEKYEPPQPPAASRTIKKERAIKEEILSDVEEGDLTSAPYQVKQERFSDDSEHERYPANEDSSMDSFGTEGEEMDDGEIEREGNGFQHITGEDSSDETLSQQIWKKRGNRSSSAKRPAPNASQTKPLTGQSGTLQDQPPSTNQSRKMKSSPTRRFVGKQSQQQQSLTNPVQVISTPTTPTDSKTPSKVGSSSDTSVFKPVSTSALDVAAHLKLLGESLTIIGERLTEHEGQIAVSGSFSVLLDSLLCALGPLLCLTQQVPQMNVVPQEQLSQIMDNIAYIMPGL